MSAFIVAPETISSLVDVIAKHEPVDNRDLLAKRLFLLNVESVNQRYQLKDSDSEDSRKEHEGYLADAEEIRYHEQPERNPAQHVMATRCWLYQSCEGDCNQDPLFLAVSKIADKEMLAVASEIAGKSVSDTSQAYDIISNYLDKNNLDHAWD